MAGLISPAVIHGAGLAGVDIESEVNRYIAWPGQANAYMLGMLENGSITLPMPEDSIEAWIDEWR